MKGLLIDPVTAKPQTIEFDRNDWRAIQGYVGGFFDYFFLRDDTGCPHALVYCAYDSHTVSASNAFSFSGMSILDQKQLYYNWPIVGKGVLVAFDGTLTSDFNSDLDDAVKSIRYYSRASNARADRHYRSVPSNDAFYISDNLYELQTEQIAGCVTPDSKRNTDFANFSSSGSGFSLNKVEILRGNAIPDSIYAHDRAPREFIPRSVGPFPSGRCSIAELESAFLGSYEWVRKDSSFHRSAMARAYDAPPFIFPEGLEPGEQELEALAAVQSSGLTLPFPMDAFWVVNWDTWMDGGYPSEGPVMRYFAGTHMGFWTHAICFDRKRGYSHMDSGRYGQLGRTPTALIFALHRIDGRQQVIERVKSTPEIERINSGRTKSKHGLVPLPGFIRVTDRVIVDNGHSLSSGTSSERCRHDRRAHWRKRRKGVELPPEQWVRIRQAVIRADKPMSAPKPYVVT